MPALDLSRESRRVEIPLASPTMSNKNPHPHRSIIAVSQAGDIATVVLVDATHPLEHQDLTIADMALDEGRAVVIAINKWDLIEDKQAKLKDIKETLKVSLAQAPDVPLITLSALSGRGIDRLREAVINIYAVWNKRVSTHKLNEWLNEALQRHAPPTAKGRRIKIRFMTQPSTRPPTFVAFCSQPTGLPKAYLRYLTNSLRDAFQLPGVPIRINLRKGDNPFARD